MDLCALGVGAGLCVAGGALYLVLDPARPRGAHERAWADAARRLRGSWRSARVPLGPALVVERGSVTLELVPQPRTGRLQATVRDASPELRVFDLPLPPDDAAAIEAQVLALLP